jgi:hypothetical protein
MTFTFKLARRLARLRSGPALLLPFLAACAAGEPTGITSPTDTPANSPVTAAVDGPVAVNPRQVTLEGNQRVLFRAFESLAPGSSQVSSIEWTATGGTIGTDGSYSSTSTGSFRVVGKRKGNPKNPPDTSVVTVVPPQPSLIGIEISPSAATVGAGMQQQFSVVGLQSDSTQVPVGVTWTGTGGSIDAGGLYTAASTSGSYRVIATHVTTGLADTATVTVPGGASLSSITLSPGTVSLNAGQGQQFSVTGHMSDGTTASVPVTYAATGGSVSATGAYTAGSTAGTFRVIATAQGGLADTSAVTISVPAPTLASITLSPGSVSLGTGTTQQFSVSGKLSDGTTTSVSATYSATGGTISTAGLYAAGTTAGSFRVIATAQGKADTSAVTITAPTLSSITLTPGSVSLNAGQGQQFSVSGKLSDGTTTSVSATYSATGGTVSPAGYYSAGSTAGAYRFIATAQGKADTSAITIAAPSGTGTLTYNADFESGAYPSGTTYEQCQAGRIAVYSNTNKPAGAPNALAGTHFSGHTVLDTDVSPCTPTSNPRTSAYKQAIFHPGDEVWESFSVYLPVGFPKFPYYLMFQEDYGAPFNSPPPNGVWMQNYDGTGNRFYITGNYDGATKTNVRVWSAPATPGVWHTWLVHKRFATDKSGWLEVWFDGQQVTFSNGSTRLTNQQTMLTGATSANFSLMHYRHAGMFPVSSYPNGLTLYFDEARVGTSRSAVELQSTLFASIP